jgi:adenylyltransferase/sulfurtransferase
VLYNTQDIGQLKAATAAEKLRSLNPHNRYVVHAERVEAANVIHLIKGYDIVIDGTDNFATRYLINDACILMGKPLVFGAIHRYEGQVAVLCVSSGMGEILHYRDIFPHPPNEDEVLNCAEIGVLGVLPGIIGGLMANEALKLLIGMGKPLAGKLLTYHALTNEVKQWHLSKHPDSDALVPTTVRALQQKDYAWECGLRTKSLTVNYKKVQQLLQQPNVPLIDVREPYETPELTDLPYTRIPLAILMEQGLQQVPAVAVFVCQSGKRSLRAAQWMLETYPGTEAYSVEGGIFSLL